MKLFLILLFLFVGCNSQVPELSSISGSVSDFGSTVRLNVTGMGLDSFEVNLNGEERLLVSQNGTIDFKRKLPPPSYYEVAISRTPKDRNCFIETRRGAIASEVHTVNVECLPVSEKIYTGYIFGGLPSTIQLTIGTESTTYVQTIDSGAKVLKTPPISGVVKTISFTQPSSSYCYFLNGSASSVIPPGATPDFNIWCGNNSRGTYNISVQVTGLDSGKSIEIGESATNNKRTLVNGTQAMIFGASGLQRYVLEIIKAPTDQRCSFQNTDDDNHKGSYLYSFKPVASHTFIVNCDSTPRPQCGYSGTELPAVDKKINDIICANDRILYAGDFRMVGRPYGVLAFQDINSSSPSLKHNYFDRIHGKVNKIIPDGKGGFFAVGLFERVGNQNRKNIVRLTSNLMIDETFKVGTDGEIVDVIYKDYELFLFGSFSHVQTFTGEKFFRKGFAKVDLTSVPATVTEVKLAPYIDLRGQLVSASLIDWNLYFHSGGTSYVLNKVTGNLISAIPSGANEYGNTLYWRDSSDGEVWMITNDLGMVHPRTLAKHRHDQASGNVRPLHYYTLIGDTLYQTDVTKILKTTLTSAAFTKTSFGITGSNTTIDFRSLGVGFGDENNVCFFQRGGTLQIESFPSEPTLNRKGLACFTATGTMLPINPNFEITGTSGIMLDSEIFIANSFFRPVVSNSLVSISAKTHDVAQFNFGFTKSEAIKDLELFDDKIMVGGNFTTTGACSTCKYFTTMSYSSDAYELARNPQLGLNGPVRKFNAHLNMLGMITEDPLKELIFLDDQFYPTPKDLSAPPDDLRVIGDAVLTKKGDHLQFWELKRLGGTPELHSGRWYGYGGPIEKLQGNFVLATDSQNLSTYTSEGEFDSSHAVFPYAKESALLTTNDDHLCMKQGPYINCYQNGVLRYSRTVIDENQDVFRYPGNYPILGKGFGSSPVVLYPIPTY